MSDRVNPYYQQEVTHGEVDQWHDQLEDADQNIVEDHDSWGVTSGLVVSENAPPDFSVLISDGIAYDEQGRRIVLSGGPTAVDLTAQIPANPGEERYVGIYVETDRAESDPRIDGDAVPLNYLLEESAATSTQAGAAAAPPAAKPAIQANKVLLANVLLTNGMASILNADINTTWYNVAAASVDRQVGGSVAPGRLLGEEKRIAFDPAVSDIVITIGNTNTLDGDGGDITMGGGDIDTEGGGVQPGGGTIDSEGGIIQSGAGDIDSEGGDIFAGGGDIDSEGGDILSGTGTIDSEGGIIQAGGGLIDSEGGDIETGGGDLNAETGDVLNAGQVSADTPDPSSSTGHVYRTPATGSLIQIEKNWDVSAIEMLPEGSAVPQSPWVNPVFDEWQAGNFTILGYPSWQMTLTDNATSRYLIAPIQLPDKCLLYEAVVNLEVVAPMPATINFYAGVSFIDAPTPLVPGAAAVTVHTVPWIYNNVPPAWYNWNAMAPPPDTPLTIDNATYSYYAWMYMDDTNAGVDPVTTYVRVVSMTLKTIVREASFVY